MDELLICNKNLKLDNVNRTDEYNIEYKEKNYQIDNDPEIDKKIKLIVQKFYQIDLINWESLN